MFRGKIQIPKSDNGQYKVEARSLTGDNGYGSNGEWRLNSPLGSLTADIYPFSNREYRLDYDIKGKEISVIVPRVDIREAYCNGIFKII